ncbi:MAG: NADPH-dependent FMN reductase [Thermomicrobiales bacterium]
MSDMTQTFTPATDRIRILGIGGSMRAVSRNRVVTRTLLDLAEEAGAETVFADVRALDLPVYNEDIPLDQQPANLHWLIRQIQAADGFIVESPNYHGTITGAIKNVLDAVHIMHGNDGTYFDGRPVGLAGFGGASTANVINALYHSVRGMRGLVVPTTVAVTGGDLEMAGAEGRITSQAVLNRGRTMIAELVDIVELQRLRASREAVAAD